MVTLIVALILTGSIILCLEVRPAARFFQDQTGGELLGSIALLEELEINGMKQWISVRGKEFCPHSLFLGK